MEKAEISRLINSFNAIKGYFDTTKKYMPQIAKLVFFIEEVIPLLNTIHEDLHQSSKIIPTASEKLDKVTSATEMATTEVMDMVDKVIGRLNTMSTTLNEVEEQIGSEITSPETFKEKVQDVHEHIDGSQDDLFSIMNALQFQDITTQQIQAIGQVIDNVQTKIGELLHGFDDDGFKLPKERKAAFDSNAEFDFARSKKSQNFADEYLKKVSNDSKTEVTEGESESSGNDRDSSESPDDETAQDDIILGDDGQPDISAIMNKMKNTDS